MKHSVAVFCLSAGLFSIAQAAQPKEIPVTATAAQAVKVNSYPSARKEKRFSTGRSWMQQQRDRRINRRKTRTYILPGSVISAESYSERTAGDYQELPEDVWTPLHQKAYNDLIAGKVAAALKSVLILKKEGGSVDVAVPNDIRRRTLLAVAFDTNKEPFKGSLKLRPEWPNLISELQDDN